MKGVTTTSRRGDGEVKVLRVDPESSREREISRALESPGCQVKTVASGRQAAQLGDASQPEVLVTDWLLEETWFHGLHLAAALRRVLPKLRVVLATDFATPDVGYEALQLGVHEILPRSVSPERLVRAIRAALATQPKPHWKQSLYPLPLLERILDKDPPEPGKECPFGDRALIVDSSTWIRRLAVRELERIFCVAHSVSEPDWALRLLDQDPQIDLVIFDVDGNRLEVKNLVERLMVRHPEVIRIAQGRDPSRLDKIGLQPEHFLQIPWSGTGLLRLLLQ